MAPSDHFERQWPPRYEVAGVWLNATTLDQAAEMIVGAACTGAGGYVCVTGAHGVVECQSDPRLKEIHNSSWLTVPDGMPLVWIARVRGISNVTRVYGPDLMRRVLALSSASSLVPRGTERTVQIRHGFVGATQDLLDALVHRIQATYPGVPLVGTWPLPFRGLTDEEWSELLDSIRAAAPDILWVGMSTPKQERFMAEWCQRWSARSPHAPCPVLVGVGAAFDILSGRRKDAPRWIQRSGLQWLYRLLQEPRRLGPRYLRVVPCFLWLAVRSLCVARALNRREK